MITIITLLISILLPALAAARRAAQAIQCMSNQRQLGVVFRLWEKDHDGKIVPHQYPSVRWQTGQHHTVFWPQLLGRYQSASGGTTYSKNDYFAVISHGISKPLTAPLLTCPAESRPIIYGTSGPNQAFKYTQYAINRWLGGIYDEHGNPFTHPPYPTYDIPHTLQSINKPFSSVIQLMDNNYYDNVSLVYPQSTAPGGARYRVAYRHSSASNVLYFDGHVSTAKKGTLVGYYWRGVNVLGLSRDKTTSLAWGSPFYPNG